MVQWLRAGLVLWLVCINVSYAARQEQLVYLRADEAVVGEWEGPYLSSLEVHDPSGHRYALKRSDTQQGEFYYQAKVSGVHHFYASATMQQWRLRQHVDVVELVSTPPSSEVLPSLLSPRLQALQQALQNPSTDTNEFWEQVATQGTPLLETLDDGQLVLTLLWRGSERTRNVRVVGGLGTGNPWLQQLPHSDVWFSSMVVSEHTAFSYQFVENVPEAEQAAGSMSRQATLSMTQLDPFNPRQFPTGADKHNGVHSIVELAAAPRVHTDDTAAEVARVRFHRLTSLALQNEREIAILPSVYGAEAKQLLLMFDMGAYLERAALPSVIGALERAHCIAPTNLVLVGNPSVASRSRELPPNPKLARFVRDELLPFVAQQGLDVQPEHTVVVGSSYGGLAATYLGLTQPDLISSVISLSGSFWWPRTPGQHEWLTHTYIPQAVPHSDNTRFIMSVGNYEGGLPGVPDIKLANQNLVAQLRASQREAQLQYVEGGHDYYSWRTSLAQSLVALAGSDCPVLSHTFEAV